MKWIKVAIGAVIAILSISVITTTVYKMTQSREVIKEVSFEINYNEGTYSPISVYNDILEYSVIDYDYYNTVSNVIVYIDNEIANSIKVHINSDSISFGGNLPNLSGIIDSYITNDGMWYNDGGTLDRDITVKLIFEVSQPPQLTGTNATLILLIPIVFIGGVLLYFYKPLKKD